MQLQLKYDENPNASLRAAFVRGKSPEQWLAALQTWGIPLESLELYAVPESVRTIEPAGLLVVFSPDKLPDPGLVAEPFVAQGPKLLMPQHSKLFPAISPEELNQVLIWPRQFFHPVYGLSGFAPEDQLDLGTLLIFPPKKETKWIQPPEGNPAPPQLNRISLPAISTKDVMQAIGEELEQKPLKDLPDDEEEEEEGFFSGLGKGIFKAAHSATKGLNDSLRETFGDDPEATEDGVLTQFEKWLGKKSDELFSKRKSEIERLKELFKKDPSEALKFALPLDSPYSGRGTAPPGHTLGKNSTNFDLGNLGGGRAGDAWEIGSDYYELRDHYLLAANGALKNGDFRLAAYIHAKLLGDFRAAANALEQGKYYREAAVLYKDHLKDAAKAAECLERGGLFFDAIEIYLDLKRYEKAGELYESLGQWEQAEKWYEKTLEICLKNHDYMAAARVQNNRLKQPEAALQTYLTGWKTSSQHLACLEKYLKLRCKNSNLSLAETIHETFENHTPEARRVDFLDVLLELVKKKTAPSLGHETQEIAYKLVSEQSETGNHQHLQKLRYFVSEDRLFLPDVTRFVQANRKSRQVIKLEGALKAKTSFQLDSTILWHKAVTFHNEFLAIGTKAKSLYLARGNWDNQIKYYALASEIDPKCEYQLTLDSLYANKIYLTVENGTLPFSQRKFPSGSHFGEIEIIHPSWLPDQLVTFNLSNKGQVTAIDHNQSKGLLGLSQYTLDGHLTMKSETFATPVDPAFRMRLPGPGSFMRKGHFYFVNGDRLTRRETDPEVKYNHISMSEIGWFMAISPGYSALRIAVAHERGFSYFRPGSTFANPEISQFSKDLSPVDIQFIPFHNLVVAGSNRVDLYNLDGATPKLHFQTESEVDIVAVLATTKRDQFAILKEDGEIKVFGIEKE